MDGYDGTYHLLQGQRSTHLLSPATCSLVRVLGCARMAGRVIFTRAGDSYKTFPTSFLRPLFRVHSGARMAQEGFEG
jgi:hypothetical protein